MDPTVSHDNANQVRLYQGQPAPAAPYPYTHTPDQSYSSGDDRDPSVHIPLAHDPRSSMPQNAPLQYPPTNRSFNNQQPGMPIFPSPFDRPAMHVYNSASGAGNFTQIQPSTKKRPKYTRSKAGCLTCRTKKIKCDEVKPVCTRCEHSQRECTWPVEQPKKKQSRRVRQSTSPEDGGPPSAPPRGIPGSSSGSRPARTGSLAFNSASEESGSTFSGLSTDENWASLSGSEDGDEGYGPNVNTQQIYAADGSLLYPNLAANGLGAANRAFGIPAPGQPLYGNYGNNGSQTSLDLSSLTAGLPATFSISSTASSPAPMPNVDPPQPNLYTTHPTQGLGYGLPAGVDPLLGGYNHLDPTGGLRYNPATSGSSADHIGGDGRNVHWNLDGTATSVPLDASQYSSVSAGQRAGSYDEYDDAASSLSSLSSAPSIGSPNSLSPNSAASPADHSQYTSATSAAVGLSAGDLSAYTTPSVSMSSGQWANTPLVIQGGLDPIEPFFKTARERNLIRHYSNYSTDLIMAIRTHAVLNPILATALPITISVPPRQNASVEALRLSLLGVAAIHQAYLYSRNDPNRSFKELGALARSPAASGQAFGDSDPARNSAESLRLGLLLRQNANQCLAYAVQTFDGSWSNAALAASISIALIDILAGGQNYHSNLMLAKTLIQIRGGPEMLLSQNPPQRTTFGSGILVSTARLLLETLAVYDAFGTLTTGEEPTYLGHGHPAWWFTDDDWSYHKYSVEKIFAMSRQALFLIAKVSSLLSRVDVLGEKVQFTEDVPDHNSTSPAAIALHSEARSLLAELAKTEKEELTIYDRFSEVGADDERVAEEAGETNLGFRAMASKRIEHGSQAHMKAFQIVLLRKIFNVPRDDPRVQDLAQDILQRCLDATNSMKMQVLLTWPVIIAGCEVDGKWREIVPSLFAEFRKNCCFDIDTAEQIVDDVWIRADQGLPGADWKSVLKDKEIKVLLL